VSGEIVSAGAPSASVAVVLMSYGSPGDPSEIEAYYTDIRRGRPPTPEALADLTARYVAIGGVSPLAELTEAQRHAIQRALDEHDPGRFAVSLGMKHTDPKVEVAAAAAVAAIAMAGAGPVAKRASHARSARPAHPSRAIDRNAAQTHLPASPRSARRRASSANSAFSSRVSSSGWSSAPSK
jgi:hypothetical protein